MAFAPGHRDGCARLNVGRLNAFRLNVYEAVTTGLINGLDQGYTPGRGLRIEGADIQQILNDQTDTASLRASGFAPVAGQTIAVYDGDKQPEMQLFGGRILATTLLYESRTSNIATDLRCVDPTWLLGRLLVLKTYTAQSATAIVLDLVARFTRGVTTTHVAAGLPVVDAITFTNELIPVCLTAICERIGGNWFLDYQGDLHVFLSETPDANPITDAAPHGAADLALSEDLSQVVTHVVGRGGGVNASIDLNAGETELPVEEGEQPISWYSDSGGQVEIGTQVVQYSGVRGRGGKGAFVGTGNAPSGALLPSPAGGTSHTVGATYGYAASFVTATGETLAGPIASIKIQNLPMGTPPALSARSRGAGSYPPGMLSPGNGVGTPIRFAVQILYASGACGPLGASSATYTWDGYDWEIYCGQPVPIPGGSYYPVLEPAGAVAPVGSVMIFRSDNFGPWFIGTHVGFTSNPGWYYQCCAGYSNGVVQPVTQFGSVEVKEIPISKASGVTGRKLYRTTANGSALKLLATIANNTATSYGDTVADAALGAAPPPADTSAIKDEGQVIPGATTLPVSSTTPFSEDVGPGGGGGWVRVGALPIRYTGIGSGVLTGIPATGSGAITAAFRYGTQVLVQPRLYGIPAAGLGALVNPIRRGDNVLLRYERADADAISAMAERLAPAGVAAQYEDGRIQLVVSDSRFGLAELMEHVEATLIERKDPQLTLTFTSRDLSLQVGRLITINVTQPPIHGTFRIQKIGLSQIAISGGRATVHPLKTVEASNKLYKFSDLLRRLRSVEGGVR